MRSIVTACAKENNMMSYCLVDMFVKEYAPDHPMMMIHMVYDALMRHKSTQAKASDEKHSGNGNGSDSDDQNDEQLFCNNFLMHSPN